jgi:polyribonucleotide nucleotidyltransferase
MISKSTISAFGRWTEYEADILSINGASAALMLSEAPFMGTHRRRARRSCEWRIRHQSTHSELAESDLDLIYVGKRGLPMMIEAAP